MPSAYITPDQVKQYRQWRADREAAELREAAETSDHGDPYQDTECPDFLVTLDVGTVVKINGLPFRIVTENAMVSGKEVNARLAGLIVDPDQNDIGT